PRLEPDFVVGELVRRGHRRQIERARVGTTRAISARNAGVHHRVVARVPARTQTVGEYVFGRGAGNVGGWTDHRFQPTTDLPEALPVASPAQARGHVEALLQLQRRRAEARQLLVL